MVFKFVTSKAAITTRQAVARTRKIDNTSLRVDFDVTPIAAARAGHANVINNHLTAVFIIRTKEKKRNKIAKKPELKKKPPSRKQKRRNHIE